MKRREIPQDVTSQQWKGKMGAEFSGLETVRDYLRAFLIGIAFVVVAMVIAFLAFG